MAQRAAHRADIEAKLISVGRKHLASHGAAALSLRAIARDLELVPSALYRYVQNRDELLTLLIVDAYTSLGDAVDTAVATTAGQEPPPVTDADELRSQWTNICVALRQWACTHPHEFALLYGSPVPGYSAPADRTTPAGNRVLNHLVRLGHHAVTLGVQRDVNESEIAHAATTIAPIAVNVGLDEFVDTPETVVHLLAAWSMVIGTITAEIFEQYGPDFPPNWDAHYLAVTTLSFSLFATTA